MNTLSDCEAFLVGWPSFAQVSDNCIDALRELIAWAHRL